MSEQAKRCASLRISLELRSLRSARERILQYIQIFALKDSQTLRLDRTLKNVADDLGLTHETFYRTLAQLIEEGIIGRTKDTLSLRRSFHPMQKQNPTVLPFTIKPEPLQEKGLLRYADALLVYLCLPGIASAFVHPDD